MYEIDNNILFHEGIYTPTHIIDLVWRTLILSTRIYNEFCFELCGGFIDRVEPRLSDGRLTKLNNLRGFVNSNLMTFKPYEMFWISNFSSTNEIDSQKFIVSIKNSELSEINNYINEKVKEVSYNIDISQISQISEEVNSHILRMHEDILDSRSEIFNYHKTLCPIPLYLVPHEFGKISVVKKIWCKFRLFFIWIITKI